MTEDETKQLIFFWRPYVATMNADRKCTANDLRTAREALQISQKELARRLGVTSSAVNKFEGGDHLKRVREFADAIQCEVVFYVKPKHAKSFVEVVWRELTTEIAKREKTSRWLQTPDPHLRQLRLVAAINALAHDTKFRKAMNWSRTRPQREDYFSPTT